jgi:hypothetical protein
MYYKTMILTNLALANIINYYCRIVNYYRKKCFKLKQYLIIVIYDCKTFTVQATGNQFKKLIKAVIYESSL